MGKRKKKLGMNITKGKSYIWKYLGGSQIPVRKKRIRRGYKVKMFKPYKMGHGQVGKKNR